jgi:hypothetical protein
LGIWQDKGCAEKIHAMHNLIFSSVFKGQCYEMGFAQSQPIWNKGQGFGFIEF